MKRLKTYGHDFRAAIRAALKSKGKVFELINGDASTLFVDTEKPIVQPHCAVIERWPNDEQAQFERSES